MVSEAGQEEENFLIELFTTLFVMTLVTAVCKNESLWLIFQTNNSKTFH
jgi:hypothetical protein